MPVRRSQYGVPMQVNPAASDRSVLMVQPTLGLVLTQALSNLPLGATPASRNFVNGLSGLEKRQTLNTRSVQDSNSRVPILGVILSPAIVPVFVILMKKRFRRRHWGYKGLENRKAEGDYDSSPNTVGKRTYVVGSTRHFPGRGGAGVL